MTERRFKLTKIAPGDYLLPGNDGRSIYRLRRYREFGDLEEWVDGGLRPVRGTFWMVYRWEVPLQGWGVVNDLATELQVADAIERDDWTEWVDVEALLPTRAAAIEAALR